MPFVAVATVSKPTQDTTPTDFLSLVIFLVVDNILYIKTNNFIL